MKRTIAALVAIMLWCCSALAEDNKIFYELEFFENADELSEISFTDNELESNSLELVGICILNGNKYALKCRLSASGSNFEIMPEHDLTIDEALNLYNEFSHEIIRLWGKEDSNYCLNTNREMVIVDDLKEKLHEGSKDNSSFFFQIMEWRIGDNIATLEINNYVRTENSGTARMRAHFYRNPIKQDLSRHDPTEYALRAGNNTTFIAGFDIAPGTYSVVCGESDYATQIRVYKESLPDAKPDIFKTLYGEKHDEIRALVLKKGYRVEVVYGTAIFSEVKTPY